MKSLWIYLSIAVISCVFGVGLCKQLSTQAFLNHELSHEEAKLYLDIKEKCSNADKMGTVFFKKYGNDESNSATSSPEWNEAQAWEQACGDAFEHLRDYLKSRP